MPPPLELTLPLRVFTGFETTGEMLLLLLPPLVSCSLSGPAQQDKNVEKLHDNRGKF